MKVECQLTREAAHDINNLMGVILGYCEILKDETSLSESARQMVSEIHHAGISTRNLARRLLASSQGQMLQLVTLDLNEVVSRMEKMLGRLIGKDVQLTSSLDGNLGRISGNQSQIEQVLLNLIFNARDAMPEGGEILIKTANIEIDEIHAKQYPSIKPGRCVMLSVSDSGIGMDQKTQSHIFEPFYSTKSAGQGTGLGLHTVSSIVEQCGGTIAVSSEPGSGTTFNLYFPRCGEAPAVKRQQEDHSAQGGTETILLIDDSTPLRKLMRRLLVDNGYTVLDSGDPAEALYMATAYPGPIPLMITDMTMPGFSGTVLAERFAAINPESKVLYMSGYKGDLMVPSCVRGQDCAFLTKPFSLQDLLEKVRWLLDSSRNPTQQTVF